MSASRAAAGADKAPTRPRSGHCEHEQLAVELRAGRSVGVVAKDAHHGHGERRQDGIRPGHDCHPVERFQVLAVDERLVRATSDRRAAWRYGIGTLSPEPGGGSWSLEFRPAGSKGQSTVCPRAASTVGWRRWSCRSPGTSSSSASHSKSPARSSSRSASRTGDVARVFLAFLVNGEEMFLLACAREPLARLAPGGEGRCARWPRSFSMAAKGRFGERALGPWGDGERAFQRRPLRAGERGGPAAPGDWRACWRA